MKKILFVINTLGYGGAEKALLQILKRIDPKEYEIDLYVLLGQGELRKQLPAYVNLLNTSYDESSVLSKEGKKNLKQVALRLGFSKGSLIRNFPYLLKQYRRMRSEQRVLPEKLLWRIMSDGAMKNATTYDVAVAFIEGGSTYYVSEHIQAEKKVAFIHVDYSQAGYHPSLDGDCYSKFDSIYGVSQEVVDAFLKEYPELKDRTSVFENIIDQREIRELSECAGGFSDDYDGIRILSVGRLTSQKAFEYSIRSLAKLRDRGIAAKWYVLGEGELREELQREIGERNLQDDFLLLGVKENPYPYYRQCDIFVQASRFEGKSIAVREAQTLGCAIIVSDTSGNKEQVTNGVDGFRCKLDENEIADAIQKLVDDSELRKRFEKCSSEKVFETPEEQINELLRIKV